MEIEVGDRVRRKSDGKVGTVQTVGIVSADVLFDGDASSCIVLIEEIEKCEGL